MYSSLRLSVYLLGYVLLWLHTFQFCAINQKKLMHEVSGSEKTYLPQLEKELGGYLRNPHLTESVSSIYSGVSLFADAILIFASICRSILALNTVVAFMTSTVITDTLTSFVAYREVKRYCLINELKFRAPRYIEMDPKVPTKRPTLIQKLLSTKYTHSSYGNNGQTLKNSSEENQRNIVIKSDPHSGFNSSGLFRSVRIEDLGEKGCDYIVIDYTFPLPLAFVFWRTVCVFAKLISIALILCLSRKIRRENLFIVAGEMFKQQRLLQNSTPRFRTVEHV